MRNQTNFFSERKKEQIQVNSDCVIRELTQCEVENINSRRRKNEKPQKYKARRWKENEGA